MRPNFKNSISSKSQCSSSQMALQIKRKSLEQNKNILKIENKDIQNENIESINYFKPTEYGLSYFNEKPKKYMKTAYLVKNRQEEIEQLKIFRPIMSRNKRRKVIKVYPMIRRISKCNSKTELIKIFSSLTLNWKQLIKKYMERCFLLHLHLRQIKDFSELMHHRQNIYDALEDPVILESRVNFANNLVKNFCKGLTNFIIMFFDELIQTNLIVERKRRPQIVSKFSSSNSKSFQS